MATQNGASDMPYDDHDESGQFKRRYTPEKVLGALEEYGGSASTSEVAETIGSSRRLALLRLRELEGDDRVTAREIGNTFLWRIDDDEGAQTGAGA